MVDYGYVHKGLSGLARAGDINAMAGHLGAAVVAGYLFSEDHVDLPEPIHQGVQTELDRILRGDEAIWFNQKQAGLTIPQLFEPFPDIKPQQKSIERIAQALNANIATMHQSGHNVIFAAIALRALRDHGKHATAPIVDGICRLIKRFDGATPGRGNFGKPRGWLQGEDIKLPEAADFPLYVDQQAMIDTTIDELIASAAIRRQGFGGLHHLINHAAGLVELSLLGYREIAQKGLPAHRHHVRLLRHLPDLGAELGPVVQSPHDPHTVAYWSQETIRRDTAMLTHRIKTLYGFTTLLRYVEDEKKRQQAKAAFRYLVA